VERALTALERVLPLAAAAGRLVRAVALVALGAAAVIAFSLLRNGLPEPPARAVVTVAVALAVFVPGVVLFVLHRALADLARLPARLRAAPAAGREHVSELSRLAGRDDERPSGWRALPRLWRLLALRRSTRALLTPYAPLAALLSPPFLVAAGLSLLTVPILLTGALVALLAVALA
jgi:hypothetical protein